MQFRHSPGSDLLRKSKEERKKQEGTHEAMTEESREEVGAAQEPRLLTLEQVSHLLHLSRATLYRLMSQEGLPTLRFGRAVRVHPIRLQAWLEQREEHPFDG